MCMGTKTISIGDDVYKALSDLKRDDESFTELIGRLIRREDVQIDRFFGALKERAEAMEELIDDVRKIRKQAVTRS